MTIFTVYCDVMYTFYSGSKRCTVWLLIDDNCFFNLINNVKDLMNRKWSEVCIGALFVLVDLVLAEL